LLKFIYPKTTSISFVKTTISKVFITPRVYMYMDDILKFLNEKKKAIDSVIKKYIPDKLSKEDLEFIFSKARYEYDIEALQKSLSDPVWEFLNRGGKRWRPALFLLLAEAFGVKKEDIGDFVVLFELTHTGCLTGDTKILKNPGEQVRIDQIKPGDVVYTVNEEGNLETNKVLKVKMTGKKEVYRLVTTHRIIKATKNHMFLVMTKDQPIRCEITPCGEMKLKRSMPRGGLKECAHLLGKSESLMQNALSAKTLQMLEKKELETIFQKFGLKLTKKDYVERHTKYQRPIMKLGWKKLEDLKPGDIIIVLRKIPDKGKPLNLPVPPKDPPKDKTKIPRKTTEKFCQMFGYILGDGCVTIDNKSSRLYITPSNDQNERNVYKKIFRDLFGYELKKETIGNYERFFCCSYKVCWLLRKLGLGKSASTKKIPEWIFTLPEKQKRAMVRGYLDSDGTVTKNGFVIFSSASRELIEGLKLLLDSMGMTTGVIRRRTVKNLWKISKKKKSVIWSISLSNPREVLKKIGTERIDYKKRMLNAPKGREFIFAHVYPRPPIDMEHLRFDTVKRIEKVGVEPVYDIMVENAHNFIAENIVVHNSIIIDDVEDEGELRRGKPCLHKIFGIDTAINAGNFLYFLPLLSLIKNKEKFDKETILRIYEIYSQEMINIHAGQATDIYWHKTGKNNIIEKQYFQMCAYKTGTLARMVGRMAVAFAGKNKEIEEKMGKIMETIGIAFQIQDDILDIITTGEEREKFGKAFGNDITEGKRTLMVIHTLNKATPEDRKRLDEILKMHTKDRELIKEAIEIIKKYDSINYAKNVAKKMIENAWKEADLIIPENEAKHKFKLFMDFLINRKI
jgi:geranylgeranyl pyrophosphate synthase